MLVPLYRGSIMLHRNFAARSSWWLAPLCALVGGFAIAAEPSTTAPARAMVVESVAKQLEAEKAGLRPGDVVVAWSRPAVLPANPAPAQGEIGSPIDLTYVETEQRPRGPVTLTFEREGRPSTVMLGRSRWGLEVRPSWTAEPLASYENGRALVEGGKPLDAATHWKKLADELSGSEQHRLAAWVLLRAAKALASARQWAEADPIFEQALSEAERADALTTAQALMAAGDSHLSRRELERAGGYYQRAVRRYETLPSASVALAACLRKIGSETYHRGDLPAAEGHYRRAQAIWESEAPDSAEHGTTLRELGAVVRDRGDLGQAEAHGTRAVALHEASAPNTTEHAESLKDLGNVSLRRGRLEEAEERLQRAHAIVEVSDPEGPRLAGILNMLAGVAQARGDLATAEGYLRRVLALLEKRSPDTQDVGNILANLGILASGRGDWGMAKDLFERALMIHERRIPGSPILAATLHNVGLVQLKLGQVDRAQGLLHRAQSILERLAPNTDHVADTLNVLGEVSLAQGDVAAAEEYHRRALAIYQKLAPDSREVAGALAALGAVAGRRGEAAAAGQHYRRALAIQETLAPGTTAEASSLHELGRLERASGNAAAAAQLLCRAIDSLEQQRMRLGGTQEARSGFAAEHADFYRDCLAARLALGERDQAFHVLERSRARELLGLLAERDILTDEVPKPLALTATRIDRDYDRVQAEMAGLSPAKDMAKIDPLAARLRDLSVEREHLRDEIRKSAPRLAELRYPEPLARVDAQQLLDDGTALLSYSIGSEKTTLFVLTRTELSVFDVPAGRAVLEESVSRFRRLLERGRLDGGADEAMHAQGAELFRLLIQPAASAIERSQRLLICPDGPLQVLPFAALVWKPGPRYLVEWKPLHTVVSATVYATLLKSRRGDASWPVRLAAFGDPSYPPAPDLPAADGALRSMVDRGFHFERLPASRIEVERVKAQFAHASRQAYLGREATEERVKSLGHRVRYVHFACHAYLDRRFPLNSALVLTIPAKLEEGRDNGLLQAWEIFEKVRIESDLVTLSACETGLGKEMGGEGLLGLTRAFQYAGAQSILASLWKVSDRSTAELMPRFYRHLNAGKSKDAALQAAQLEMIGVKAGSSRRRPKLGHPFHWAAFQLTGDWR